MNFDHAIATDRGPRWQNEDSVSVWSPRSGGIAVAVADGLGGHAGGKEASVLAISLFGEAISAAIPDLSGLGQKIHLALRAKQEMEPALEGMATTLSAAWLLGDKIVTLHCGDTRIALQRGSGIRRLTRDQTEAQRLLDAGKLSKEEFVVYPRKNVLESVLGAAKEPTVELNSFTLEPLDRVIVTSDGVHGKLLLREMKAISDDCRSVASFVKRVMDAVQDRGPEDNFTIAAVFVS